ncbi:hypothetical protein [Lichenicoccus sp.]|uniref:hypothetical protein n=1 Tax=Lichenicoccus sp. TaxID=2781899 RepID=UPI003D13B6C8
MTIVSSETFRRPRCRLVVSGTVIDGCHSVELSTSNLGQAGSFYLQIAYPTEQFGPAAPWYSADTLDVSIQMGLLPLGMPEGALVWQEMMSGRVDRVRLDPITGTLTLDGRDYAARLIDLSVTEGFLNQTSAEVATQLAGQCGLTPVVDQTSAMIGQYYQLEHARSALPRFSRFGTAWDLLSHLAQLEGFDLWVIGEELHFQSASSSNRMTYAIDLLAPSPRTASPSVNVSSLVVERCLALGGGLPVKVSSWNSRQRLRVSATAGGEAAGGFSSINVVRPNLLPDAAQILADGIYRQTVGHQRTLTATMPGDLNLSPRDGLTLTGVGAGWDGSYRIDTIDREMTLSGGFVQRCTAKVLSE